MLNAKHFTRYFLRYFLGASLIFLMACGPKTSSTALEEHPLTEDDNPNSASELSARRHTGEDFDQAKARSYKQAHQDPNKVSRYKTVEQAKVPFSDINDQLVQDWQETQLMDGFLTIRDLRYLYSTKQPTFPRRLTWLYPDDGCYARAHGMNSQLKQLKYSRPNNVFIFGNLHVDTANHPDGYVEWWYHVAPIVKIDGKIFVIDPAIEPKQPLLLKDWVLRQVTVEEEAEIAICDANAYTPSDSCQSSGSFNDHRMDKEHAGLLRYEWSRQLTLKRNPEEVLGDRPLWYQNFTPDATPPVNTKDSGVPSLDSGTTSSDALSAASPDAL